MASDEEEDDYMNMAFGEDNAKPTAETSLQRRQRLKREGEMRGRVKSKAELAAEEREEREAALSRSLLEGARARKSKGFAMMAKMGFKAGGTLGATSSSTPGSNGNASGGGDGFTGSRSLVEPLRPEMKDDRGGIGLVSERKRRFEEAAAEKAEREKRTRIDEDEYRDRVRREREAERHERMVYAAMKVCERLDEENGQQQQQRTLSTRPLKSIPVVWRGLVRRREESERDRRMKHDLQQSSSTPSHSLPTLADDHLGDEDDRMAMGRSAQIAYSVVEDLDEEDEELDEFSALEPGERLRRIVDYLRKEHRYCFWCKFQYPDDTLDGCPGKTEEDHD
ncbi:putative G-patch domain protein [Xylariaceae sp. FL0594]|nr:putative G-patch domain protein [Xylariaceae sp. FL0594]